MLSLHPLSTTVQADRERAIRDRAPVPTGRPATQHPGDRAKEVRQPIEAPRARALAERASGA